VLNTSDDLRLSKKVLVVSVESPTRAIFMVRAPELPPENSEPKKRAISSGKTMTQNIPK
jgi:hypothetical protein